MDLRLPPLAGALLLCATIASAGSLDVLPGEQDVFGWDVVLEVSEDGRRDVDLRGWGVVEKHVRHYTRDVRGRIDVCSIEVWEFRDRGSAKAALAGFAFPDWQISAHGRLLVMVRGLMRPVGRRPARGVFADCGLLGRQVKRRAARHVP